MSKKSKKFDADATGVADTETNLVVEVANDGAGEVAPIGKPKAPTLFLADDSTGLHYKLDRRNHLPKKATVAGNINIDGIAVPYQCTSNKGWAVDESKTIDYLWFTLPEGVEGAGLFVFMTLDYTVAGATMDGVSFRMHAGTPDRFPMKADGTGYAQRLGKEATEEARKKAFSESMAKKKEAAAAAATETAEVPAEA